MEPAAAARFDAPPLPRRSRRVKTTTTTVSPESNKRRRPAHITKRGRGRKRSHHAVRPCSSGHHAPNWGRKSTRTAAAAASAAAAALSTSEDEHPGGALPFSPPGPQIQIQIKTNHWAPEPKKRHKLLRRPCSSQPPSHWGAKRARTTHAPPLPDNNNWRDWANLDDGPLGLIAELLLAYDVADYLRFRAVCCPWRRCSVDPRAHGVLDRRFHPRRWTMLQEELVAPESRCFLNTSTGECVKACIPELRDHELLAVTPEGLLVLLHDRNHVRLLNPLTGHLTNLPPLTTLLPSEDHGMLDQDNDDIDFIAWGYGIASDDSTFVLCFNMLQLLGMAKPGDDHWTLLKYNSDGMTVAPLLFEGTFYCVNNDGVLVLKIGADQPPRLEVAAKMEDICVSRIADSVHLINNCGELMLVHR